MNFKLDLCIPAIVYLVLSLLGLLSDFIKQKKSMKKNVPDLLINLIIIGLITYVLNYVCVRYSVTTSWYILAGIVLIPIFLALLTIYMISTRNKN
jgi:hypothetical protein